MHRRRHGNATADNRAWGGYLRAFIAVGEVLLARSITGRPIEDYACGIEG